MAQRVEGLLFPAWNRRKRARSDQVKITDCKIQTFFKLFCFFFSCFSMIVLVYLITSFSSVSKHGNLHYQFAFWSLFFSAGRPICLYRHYKHFQDVCYLRSKNKHYAVNRKHNTDPYQCFLH